MQKSLVNKASFFIQEIPRGSAAGIDINASAVADSSKNKRAWFVPRIHRRSASGIDGTTAFIFFVFQILALVATFLVAPKLGHAQLQNDVNIIISPNRPGDHETVQASVESFAVDTNSSTVTWYVDGKKVGSGVGLKNITFNTGNLGQPTSVKVLVFSNLGEKTEKTISIVPASVDLIWEANTYTPPFFKGKALYTHQSTLTFIAVPHMANRGGVEIDPSKLIYKWTNAGYVVGDKSGYGKNTFSVTGGVISRPIQVDVEVTNPDTGDIVSQSSTIEPQDPFVAFYKRDPLYGVNYGTMLEGSVDFSANELSIAPAPYYFASPNLANPNMLYEWKVNGYPAINTANTPYITFRKDSEKLGNSTLSLNITHRTKILQSADGSININILKNSQNSSL